MFLSCNLSTEFAELNFGGGGGGGMVRGGGDGIPLDDDGEDIVRRGGSSTPFFDGNRSVVRGGGGGIPFDDDWTSFLGAGILAMFFTLFANAGSAGFNDSDTCNKLEGKQKEAKILNINYMLDEKICIYQSKITFNMM